MDVFIERWVYGRKEVRAREREGIFYKKGECEGCFSAVLRAEMEIGGGE